MVEQPAGARAGGVSIKLLLVLAAVGYAIYLVEDQASAWWQWYRFRGKLKDIMLFSVGIPTQKILACVVRSAKQSGVDLKPPNTSLQRDIAEGKLNLLVKWDRPINFKHKVVDKSYKLEIFEGLPMAGRECKKILGLPDEETMQPP